MEELEGRLEVPLHVPRGAYVCYPEPRGQETCFCTDDLCNEISFDQQGGGWNYHLGTVPALSLLHTVKGHMKGLTLGV